MFVAKQFLKGLILPPMPWILLLLVVLIFWQRRWARKLLLTTFALLIAAHCGHVDHLLRYPLESRYAPLLDPARAEPYDAIVVLTAGMIPAGGLIPFPTINEEMFRRLDEARRLYGARPKPIIVSGGHVDPFTPPMNENQIAGDYLILWGIPKTDVISEPHSRDTFESAAHVRKIMQEKGWRRYLLVTSAVHMARSMLAFRSVAPEPIAAPGDFTIGENRFSPLSFFPSESAARRISAAVHEYLGLANYYWRDRFERE